MTISLRELHKAVYIFNHVEHAEDVEKQLEISDNHSFNPVVTIPSTKYFWALKKTVKTGRMAMTDAAIRRFHLEA